MPELPKISGSAIKQAGITDQEFLDTYNQR